MRSKLHYAAKGTKLFMAVNKQNSHMLSKTDAYPEKDAEVMKFLSTGKSESFAAADKDSSGRFSSYTG